MTNDTEVKGERVGKDSCLVETLGRLDSLQCQLDKCCYYAPGFKQYFRHIQYRLRDIGAEISKYSYNLLPHDIDILDSFILMIGINPPNTFVEFNNLVSIEINEARIRTRDLERVLINCEIRQECKDFCNKLSYFLFLLALKIEGFNSVEGKDELEQQR